MGDFHHKVIIHFRRRLRPSPIPSGAPMARTSPGRRVLRLFKNTIIFSTEKIYSAILACWTVTSLSSVGGPIVQSRRVVWTSGLKAIFGL